MMYQPIIPVNNKLPVEKQYEIVEIIISRYLGHFNTPETSRHISKMLDRTLRIGSLLKIIDN
jgi:hypothetical protein